MDPKVASTNLQTPRIDLCCTNCRGRGYSNLRRTDCILGRAHTTNISLKKANNNISSYSSIIFKSQIQNAIYRYRHPKR